MRRILVANIFGIGDVLFTTPLITNLKSHIKEASIDYLCNARTKDIIESIPDVDDAFIYEKDEVLKSWRSSKWKCLKDLYGLFSRIRKKKYDAVFDFTLSRKFGFFFMLAGIKRRIGLDYKNRGIFLTDKVPLKAFKGRHVTEHYLDLLKCVGAPSIQKEMQLTPGEADLEWALRYLKEKGIEKESLIAVIPGGGASWGKDAERKRWPPEGFAKAADILSGKGFSIALLGDSHEEALSRKVAGKMHQDPAITENRLTLKKYIALLSRCRLALCNDGGPLHMAKALGVKTVSIFGPVDEAVYGPYPASSGDLVIKSEEASCRPCYDQFKLPECGYGNKCLKDITPEEVAASCAKLLEGA